MVKQFTLYLAENYSGPCQESKMKLFQSLTIFAKSVLGTYIPFMPPFNSESFSFQTFFLNNSVIAVCNVITIQPITMMNLIMC